MDEHKKTPAQAKILVVEDDVLIATIIEQRLRFMNYELAAKAVSGEQAIQQACETRPDLVLMDIQLIGDMDGIEAAEQIHSRLNIPVIYLTSNDDRETLRRIRSTDPFGYILKPFSEAELQVAIEIALYKDRAEKTLKEREARFRSIVQDQSELICRYLPDERLCFVNDAYCAYFAQKADELLGTLLSGPILPEDRDKVRELLRALDRKQPVAEVEYRVVLPSGEIRWQQWRHRIILHKYGDDTEYQGTGQDISRRKQAEQSLQEHQRRLTATLKSIGDAVLTTNNEGCVTFMNPAAERLSGWTFKELQGRNISFGLLTAVPDFQGGGAIQKILREGIVINIIEHPLLVAKNGRKIPVEYSGAPIKDEEGNVTGVVLVLKDVTERKEAERERRKLEMQLRQAQRLEAIGVLAGGVAHDFNNILGTMLGYTELLLAEHAEQSRDREYLEQVYQAGERAEQLVQQILTFSHAQEKQLAPTNIAPVVQEALKMLRPIIPSTIQIHQAIHADCPQILADSTQIHQIVVNLCVNAGHAMREESGKLEVGLEHVVFDTTPDHILNLEAGSYVRLSVADSGCGMSPEQQERIFEPFFTTKAIGEGSGLGLSVVHGIVTGHHGVVDVKSEEKKGTRIQVFFPTSAEINEESVGAPKAKELRAGKESILLVDDESALARLYSIALEQFGYHVTVLHDGHEALELFQSAPEQFDLVFTDQAMPNMSGTQLSREVSNIRPELPIILTTGYSESLSEETLKESGVQRLLMKPVKIRELIQVVQELLG
ncbi:MAG: response regulator [bacterium]|nr:response regulator [bacterium]